MLSELLVFLASGGLTAQADDAELGRCIEAVEAPTDRNFGQCYERRYEAADKRLNLQWKTLLAKLTEERFGDDAPEIRQSLILAQRSWIGFRDRACAIYHSGAAFGHLGTLGRYLNEPDCRTQIVEHRISELETMIHNLDPEAEKPNPEICMDKARTNPEFAACTEAKIEKAQGRLDTEFARLLNSVREYSPRKAAALVAEQESWLAFRQTACRTYWSDWGREGEVLHGPNCIAQLINDRADDLFTRFTLENPEQQEPARKDQK